MRSRYLPLKVDVPSSTPGVRLVPKRPGRERITILKAENRLRTPGLLPGPESGIERESTQGRSESSFLTRTTGALCGKTKMAV